MAHLLVFLAGVIFSIGLAISGMTQPHKVVGFLDFAGTWIPDLAFVMGGAVMVNFIALRLTLRRDAPVFAPKFGLPTRTDLDTRLIAGSALFGLGWGLGGFCPGPAITSLVTGTTPVLVFVGSMLAGMVVFDLIAGSRADRRQAAQAS
jgi:uncharacterized membrane protein YedE/YeeE